MSALGRRGRRREKLSRNATAEEIFPSSEPHKPIQMEAGKLMAELLRSCRKAFPNYHITLFVAEKEVLDGTDRLPRFNYASTGERADMVAVLKAFIGKQEAEAAKLDRIEDPAEGSA